MSCALAESADDQWYDDRFLMFGGFDLWRGGGFAHGGMLWSPEGLGREGFSLKLLLGAGRYRYRSGTAGITASQTIAAAMPGWRFKGDQFELLVAAGLDVQEHRFVPEDPGNRLRGTHYGVRVGADLWFQPQHWLMAAASVSASSIGTSVWSRVALGTRFLDLAWVGPEFLAAGDETYRQFRIGMHVTSLRTGPLEWSAGIGYVRDSDQRSGAYGRIGMLTRQ